MKTPFAIVGLVLLAQGGAVAQQSGAPASATSPATDAPKVCQTVVSAEQGAKPYQLCLTKAEWDAKKLADSKDATRMVCHYEEQPGTRFRSAKVCMSAAEWAEQRRIERENIDRIQRSVCVSGGGC